MAYRVRPDGSIDVDSLDEAIRLSHALAARIVTKEEPSSKAGSHWSGFMEFVRDREQQMRALAFVKNGVEVTMDELRKELNVDTNNAVSGVLAGITKNAKKAGIKPSVVIVKAERGTGADAEIVYRPGSSLRDHEVK
jgi:hypothetical protein